MRWRPLASLGVVTETPISSRVSISPVPGDDEAAAIVAAIEALWPKPQAQLEPAPRSLAWRFSGRWWQRDRMAAADRPWR